MFLLLSHKKLNIYQISKKLVVACYKLSNLLPAHEKFGMISQIRRAALSVHLNIAEGASRKSIAERKRFYEIARGSVVEIDAALELAHELSYIQNEQSTQIGLLVIESFKMLTGMIQDSK